MQTPAEAQSGRVLVTAASRHGSTMEIAERIARELIGQGLSVDVMPVEDVSSVKKFDAVVLGSAMYYGHWLKAAVEFGEVFAEDLSDRAVWLFSSGPVEPGSHSSSAEGGSTCSPIGSALTIREHRIFPGALDRSRLGFTERSVVHVIRGIYGDYRDWAEVLSWAQSIGSALVLSQSDRSSMASTS